MDAVPAADISAFLSDSDSEVRRLAAKRLAESVKPHGFAAITGHGLSGVDLNDAFSNIRKLFDLPLQDKMRAPHPDGPRPHRGYLAKAIERSGKLGIAHSKSESEKAFFADAIDWKETYDIGHEDNDEQKNIWLPDDILPGFKPYMIKLHTRLANISSAILEGLMLGMNLTEEECEALRGPHSAKTHQMRLAHYLPMSSEDREDPHKIRLAAHRDTSSFTLLFQESVSGLEFQNRKTGDYIAAPPREGVMYLNIGDVMERYSNGFYPSALHRVAIDTTSNVEGTIPGRYSIPYFTVVGFLDNIYPIPSRVAADGKANFESITFQDFAAKLFDPVIQRMKAS